MLFNSLKNRSLLFGKTLVIAASACMLGCTLDPYIITAEEEYTRNFIKSFGLVDAHQDWNMATEATIKIDLGAITQKSVKVYAKHQSKYYIVADLTDLSGTIEVPVDVPEETRDILVVVNGMKYYGTIGETINCADMSRGVPGVEYNDDGTADNPNPALYTNTEGDYTVTVKHTKSGNAADTKYAMYGDNGEYQYFNTQQMAPIVSPEVWNPYFSLNMGTENFNTYSKVGLLPESGIFNREAKDLIDWINMKRDIENESIVQDFVINTGDDGSFTLFPYYYGTNLKHELGVYLLDPDTKKPIMKDGSTFVEGSSSNTIENFVSFPIFYDREPGDLQVQPHYDGRITDIRFKKVNDEGKTEDRGKDHIFTFTVGETTNILQYVQVKLGDNDSDWMDYDEYLDTYGSRTHSRVAFHFWVPDPTKTVKSVPWATCTKDGIVTGVTPTNGVTDGPYACLAIANNLVQSDLGAGKGRIDGAQISFSYNVNPAPAAIPHTPSLEVKGESAAMSLETTWNVKYFNPTEGGVVDIMDKLSDPTGKIAEGWYPANVIDPEVFENVDEDCSIVVTFEEKAHIALRYGVNNNVGDFNYKIGGDDEIKTESSVYMEQEFEIFLKGLDLEKIRTDGLGFVGPGPFYMTSLMLKYADNNTGESYHVWTPTGRADAKKDLEDYYKEYGASDVVCSVSGCGVTFTVEDLKKMVPSVTIAGDAKYNNIHYTVVWSEAQTPATKSSRKSTAKSRAASISSRAMIEPGESMLDPGPASDWRDVKAFWSRYLPAGSEVASYLPNTTMLARSRGYDVTIEVDGKPWKGSLGVYLKVVGSYDIGEYHNEGWTSVWYEDEYTPFTKDGQIDPTTGYVINQEYVVYSQKEFNKDANGKASNQISALTIKHPVSKRTFLTFEDMRLTKETGYAYDEKSSDRDVNDLIFNITNFSTITGEGDKEIKEDPDEPTDEAFSWLWAVEDLGSTDDFDFNDMVMKITSVTSNVVKKDADGKETGTTTLYKKVTFTPLCAGGTLPIYVHYAPEANGPHYILRPGAYEEADLGDVINDPDLTESPAEIATLVEEGNNNSSEIHRWFGVDDHTVMINTQTGSGVQKAESCVLYLTTGFTITGFGKEGSAKGHRGGLYVTVNDGRSVQYTDEITSGEITSGWQLDDTGESWLIVAPKEGQASQMFMIVDADTPWRWPLERCHILNPYPHFTEWVGSNTVETKWYELEGGKEGYTYPRYDLK